MRNAVVGLVAHVDAGKTTLAEALLFEAGAIRRQGRVDRGDAHLDCDAQERERGITIFSKQTALDHAGVHLMFIDAPGHVDFSAEAERTLQALDYAVLVVSGTDGVQSHTETMGELLERYGVPLFVFVNKMDLNAPAPAALLAELQQRVTSACLDGASLMAALDASTAPEAARVLEDAAATDEVALDEYLETGSLVLDTVRRLVAERKVAPVFFGSALKLDGTAAFLDALSRLVAQKTWPDAFGGRVYKVSRNARGERLAWVKVTGGELRAKSVVEGVSGASAWEEKIDQVRIYDADTYQTVTTVPAGCVCAVTGLTRAVPGSALGVEPAGEQPALAPVLSYRIEPQGCDMSAVAHAARELADEDPLLGVAWEEELQELHVQLMGEVQAEVLQRLLADRYGLAVAFSEGGVLYRETLTAPARGVGHFEPLRHYAEVHLLLEPAPRGSGVTAGTRCSEDDLDRNWQRLILTHVFERTHRGVLIGAPLDDVRVTLLAGRAHAKHTEGGDFRQATYRAIRQALMEAREAGECRLLEPWYRFRLQIPADKVGRALADLQRMSARFDPPEVAGERACISGTAPVSEMRSYALAVSGYSQGRGRLALTFGGYDACHDADDIIARAAYIPEADLPHTPDSVFCAHGAGYNVPWREVPEHAHVTVDPARLRPWQPADAAFFSASCKNATA